MDLFRDVERPLAEAAATENAKRTWILTFCWRSVVHYVTNVEYHGTDRLTKECSNERTHYRTDAVQILVSDRKVILPNRK